MGHSSSNKLLTTKTLTLPTSNKHRTKWTPPKPPSRTSCPSLVNTTPLFTRRSPLLSSTRLSRDRSTRSTFPPSTRRFTRTTTTPPSSPWSTRRSSPNSTTTTSSLSSTAATSTATTTRLRPALPRSVLATVTPSRGLRALLPATSHLLLPASTSTTTFTTTLPSTMQLPPFPPSPWRSSRSLVAPFPVARSVLTASSASPSLLTLPPPTAPARSPLR